ncbi:hypothetical protein PIROE2DRAFT_62238 [Piromyces sp. E2]|nr:hypothetical protein PIROE2DRAFT_62238 [Piromyces sp. E2]|eukprot:OUM61887.1 hypothetical protein PIROE2DRAFT_62238 [Piromyces sp. E2]
MYMVSAKDNINPEPVSQEEVPLESNDKSNNSPVLSTTNSTQSPNTNNLPIVSNIADNENNSVADNIPENEKNNSVVDNIHDNEKNNSVVDNIHDNENNTVENNIHDNENNTVENNIPENENNSVVDNIPENENNTLENIISEKENNTIENNIPENEKNNAVENNIPEKEKNNIVNQNTADQNIQLKAPKNINTESWIGKILMGALASLLVFIALITFAKVLMPYLTNTIKITLMFIVSIALTATGYVFSTKKPENTFYKALLACGSACIYLSILITDIYFKAIDSIDMYILIALWAILNIFFKKDKEDWLFFTIGNLGYLVSVIFSAGLKDNDKSLIIPLLIYVVMISVVYHILYWKNERQKYIQSIINVISLLLFQLIMTFKFDDITEVLIVGIDKNDWLFFTVGNLGYLGSIVFSTKLKTNNTSFIIPILIYTLIISMVYQIMYWKNERQRYIQVLIYALMIAVTYQIIYWKNEYQRHIQSIINVMSLLLYQVILMSTFRKTTEVNVVGIVVMVFALIGIIEYTIFDLFTYKKKHFYIALVNTSVYLISYFLLHMSMEYELPVNLTYTVIIIPTVILEVINMYWRSKNLAEDDETFRNGVLTLVLFYAASAIISTSFLYHSGIILTGYSLIMIYGIIKKDSFFKNQGWILISLCMFTKIDLFGKSTAFTIVATILSLLSLIVEGFIFNDSEIYKIISYFAMLLWIVRIEYYTYVERVFAISNEYIIIITYGIVALLNMILILTKFYKTKKNKNISNLFDSEKNSIIRIILDVLNLTYMLLGVKMMYILDIDMLKTIYTIIVIILAFINLPVKDKGSRERYIYTAIKFSFLIYYSLWIFKIQNYVISISMIAFAVVCIAVGFRNRLIGKELRIYGLVMTIIFVIKLIIIDISYDSSILKAFSYLISGTLCFGISAIYNYFEDNKNTEENDIVNNKKNN